MSLAQTIVHNILAYLVVSIMDIMEARNLGHKRHESLLVLIREHKIVPDKR